jgi:hypothetical protein
MYALFGVGALFVGALHGVLKNVPGVYPWLMTAGHGGEMAKDLSNTHIVVVGVGTILLSGLTWYVLPRICKRPLFSPGMATASFRFTALGVSGFYLAWLVLGIVEGSMVQNGIEYSAAKEAVGKWHSVPLKATGMLLGLGYWTYALNAVLTAWFAREVDGDKPHGHLIKFVVVGTVALTVGTVQGVLQVLPGNEAWLQAAGAAGRMIDPVSHAHVNLVLGTTMLTVAFFAYLAPRLGVAAVEPRASNRIFWVLLPGGLTFYVSMLLLGLYEGGQIVGRGATYDAVVARLGALHSAPIMLGGLVMTAGVWLFLVAMLRSARAAPTAVKLAITLACIALFFGTLQGPLQAIEGVKTWYTQAGALGATLPSAHAQLNILGGLTPLAVLLALACIPRLPVKRLAPAVVWLEAGALFVYAGLAYVGVQASILTQANGTQAQLTAAELALAATSGSPSAATTGPAAMAAGTGHAHPFDPSILAAVAPIGIALGLVGFVVFLVGAFRCLRLAWSHTGAFRAAAAEGIAAYPERVTGPLPKSLGRLPAGVPLGVEAFGALMGFPGIGWILAGVPVVGWPLATIGPGIAWALLPVLFNPLADTIFTGPGLTTLLYYFPATAIATTGALGWYLLRARRTRTGGGRRNILRPRVRRHRVLVGAGASVLLLALLATTAIPLFGGSVGARATYTPLATIPAESRGIFFRSGDAFVRPYPWYAPPSEFPPDSLAIRDVGTILVQDRRTGGAENYRLIEREGAHQVPLEEVDRRDVGKLEQLTLAPESALAPGRYTLVADNTSSMYGGTVDYYFTVDPAAAALAVLQTEASNASPSIPSAEPTAAFAEPESRAWSALAAVAAVLLSILVWADYVRKPAPHRLWWALGVTMFGVASSMGLSHAVMGSWNPTAYRAWYLAGALLAAAFLGHGTAWLVLPKRIAGFLTWGLVLYTGAVTALALSAPLALERLTAGDQLSGRALPEISALLWATPRFHTIFLNGYGALLLVGGALWSAWKMRSDPALLYRRWGTIAIAMG